MRVARTETIVDHIAFKIMLKRSNNGHPTFSKRKTQQQRETRMMLITMLTNFVPCNQDPICYHPHYFFVDVMIITPIDSCAVAPPLLSAFSTSTLVFNILNPYVSFSRLIRVS